MTLLITLHTARKLDAYKNSKILSSIIEPLEWKDYACIYVGKNNSPNRKFFLKKLRHRISQEITFNLCQEEDGVLSRTKLSAFLSSPELQEKAMADFDDITKEIELKGFRYYDKYDTADRKE